MNPEHIKDPITKTEIINKFDDKSMFVRFSTLSKENKKMLDFALNSEGLSLGQIENIIRMADEEQRKKIAVLLADIRMSVDDKNKTQACQDLAKLMDSI